MKKYFNPIYSIVILSIIFFTVLSFNTKDHHNEKPIVLNVDEQFNSYWYAGKAEIKTYDLTQSRYGELHKGNATVIFVTEPFLKEKGVKPDGFNKNQIPVLKMNLLKKFGTGIYPYSMMLSTFTSIEEPKGVIKSSASGQEWCGQIFSQMNQRDENYDVVSYSYFESEGDTKFTLPTNVFTEDEIWSRIRINYRKLPVGKINIIPGLYYTRLEQHKLKVEKAVATIKTFNKVICYTITYPERNRSLAISFNNSFPYEIIKWEETYADKRAPRKVLTTTAVLKESKNIDYWNYNSKKDEKLRRELNLLY